MTCNNGGTRKKEKAFFCLKEKQVLKKGESSILGRKCTKETHGLFFFFVIGGLNYVDDVVSHRFKLYPANATL